MQIACSKLSRLHINDSSYKLFKCLQCRTTAGFVLIFHLSLLSFSARSFWCRSGTLMSMSGCSWVCVKRFVITVYVCACVWNVSELIFLSVCSLYITRRKAGVATRWLNKHITQLHITQTQLVCAVKGSRGSGGTSSSHSPRLSSLLSPHSALLPSHYTLQGNENRMGKMEWNPSLCVFNCNQQAHLSMLASLCPRCVK